MASKDVVAAIKSRFSVSGNPSRIPLLRANRRGNTTFKARLETDGIYVDNLANQPFLPWIVFQEAVDLLIRNGGVADRGNAMGKGIRLGHPNLSLDSLEGHIAHVVYGKKQSEFVFRRITPIACILIWVGICEAEPGILKLSKSWISDRGSA